MTDPNRPGDPIIEEQCPYCGHSVIGTLWWTEQQMSIHLEYAHRDSA